MLYKEWLSVRLKFGLWLLLYLGLAILAISVWSPFSGWENVKNTPAADDYLAFQPKMYLNWEAISMTVTFFAAMLGGVDLVADEVDKGTLSFLLTKPITRARIYTTKIFSNLAALTVAYSLGCLVVLIADRFQPKTTPLLEGLGYTLLILIGGMLIVFLSGLISVFARTVMQTLAFTLIIPMALTMLIVGTIFAVNKVFSPEDLLPLANVITPQSGLIALALVGSGLVGGLFWAGLFSFSRKEF